MLAENCGSVPRAPISYAKRRQVESVRYGHGESPPCQKTSTAEYSFPTSTGLSVHGDDVQKLDPFTPDNLHDRNSRMARFLGTLVMASFFSRAGELPTSTQDCPTERSISVAIDDELWVGTEQACNQETRRLSSGSNSRRSRDVQVLSILRDH